MSQSALQTGLCAGEFGGTGGMGGGEGAAGLGIVEVGSDKWCRRGIKLLLSHCEGRGEVMYICGVVGKVR